MYLTYEEYVEMGGTLDATTFSDFAFQATAIIDWYTFNRLANETVVSDKVKHLMFALIKFINLQNDVLFGGMQSSSSASSSTTTTSGLITSQSNDGFSVSYNVPSSSEVTKMCDVTSPKIKALVSSYLQREVNSLGRLLLYRGIYPDE